MVRPRGTAKLFTTVVSGASSGTVSRDVLQFKNRVFPRPKFVHPSGLATDCRSTSIGTIGNFFELKLSYFICKMILNFLILFGDETLRVNH